MQFNEAITKDLLAEEDYLIFNEKITQYFSQDEDYSKLLLFIKNLNSLNERDDLQLMLLRTALFCFHNPISNGELAQFITLSMHVKYIYGINMHRSLLQAEVPIQKRNIQDYLTILQLLIDLRDNLGMSKVVRDNLPNLEELKDKLVLLHADFLDMKYPRRNIDQTLKKFYEKDDIVLFPLQKEVVLGFKEDYLAIEEKIKQLKTASQRTLKKEFIENGSSWRTKKDSAAKQNIIAIMAETVRRTYKIIPYDTQIISLLSLLAVPSEHLKGRIAQIKTGEGKSTIISMLAGFMGSQGYFVDLITSSDYLAIRDCKKFSNFFSSLGLSASHISYQEQKQEYFHAQILYGTNHDFEFALLKDGLNKNKLRYSFPLGSNELQPRTFDVVLIDEVDNMLLDVNGSARMSIAGNEDMSWIYTTILDFVTKNLQNNQITENSIADLRKYLVRTLKQNPEDINNLAEDKLNTWLVSARVALYNKKENIDYIVKEDIVIVDYSNTGRTNEGSQWQKGIHQFLQAKHKLKVTTESLTAASVSHPTYFNAYSKIFGLTGTMGEPIERKEVEEIYLVDSFDVPPHFPSQRQTIKPTILATPNKQRSAILGIIREMQNQGRPTLILFETIEGSNTFSVFLNQEVISHQLLNETQRESEDYIVARAGDLKMVTVATNTAGRGTDIPLSPESKDVGGLHMVFTFYPNNIRTEGQGFGRSGRQGNPGTCCMVLHANDRQISTLLSYKNELELQEWLVQNSAADQVNELDQLRTNKIKEESARRIKSAKLESLYFNSLTKFFDQLQNLHLEMSNDKLQEEMLKICNSDLSSLTSTANFHITKEWISVYDNAKNIIINKVGNWSSFINKFQEVFISSSRKKWALFYTDITDNTNTMSLQSAEKYINAVYRENNLEDLCSEAYCKQILSYILHKAFLQEEINLAKNNCQLLSFSLSKQEYQKNNLEQKYSDNNKQAKSIAEKRNTLSSILQKQISVTEKKELVVNDSEKLSLRQIHSLNNASNTNSDQNLAILDDNELEPSTGEEYFKKGLALYNKCNYKPAIKNFKKAAEQEYPAAYLYLGVIYKEDIAAQQDLPKSKDYLLKTVKEISWFKTQILTGAAEAQFQLGCCYCYINKKYKKAHKYYTLAANKGHANAQNNMGNLYYNGLGVTKNVNKAVKNYTLAENQDNSDAQNNLGICYQHGEGVTKDLKKAIEYYILAKKQGHVAAEWNLLFAEFDLSFTCSSEDKIKEEFDEILKKLKIDIIDRQDSNGMTLLMYALKNKFWYGAEKLLDLKADVNIKDNNDYNSLMYSCITPNKDIVLRILRQTNDVNDVNNLENSALHLLFKDINPEDQEICLQIFQEFNKLGINVQRKNNLGLTAYYYLYLQKQTYLTNKLDNDYKINLGLIESEHQFINLILQNQPCIDNILNKDCSLLLLAIQSNSIEFAKILLDNGANPNTRDDKLMYPLLYSIHNNYIEISKMLINHYNTDLNLQGCLGQEHTPLYIAISNNQTEIVNLLLDKGADVNVAAEVNDYTPLCYAVEIKQTKLVEKLLSYGANPNVSNSNRISPLLRCVLNNDENLLETLLQVKSIDVDCTSIDSICSPLYYAVESKQKKLVEKLLSYGANPNVSNSNKIPALLRCVLNDDVDLLETLLQVKSIDVDCTSIDSICSPLFYAVKQNKVEIAKILIEKKANPNICDTNNSSLLYIAVENSNIELVKLLMDNNADQNIKSKLYGGFTPAFLACSHKDENLVCLPKDAEIAKYLITHERKPDLSILGGNKNNLLMWAADLWDTNFLRQMLQDDVDKIMSIDQQDGNDKSLLWWMAHQNRHTDLKLLLEYKANPNLQDNKGNSPLHEAVSHSNLDNIKLLLANGADINIQNKEQQTPFYLACLLGKASVVEELHKQGADINVLKIGGYHPMHAAVHNGHTDIIDKLLEYGVNINIQSTEGYTPLSYCCINNISLEMVDFLLTKNSNPNIEDNLGNCAVHHAIFKNNLAAIKKLIANNANINAVNHSKKNAPPLYSAMGFGRQDFSLDIINYLLSNGADITGYMYDGDTVMHMVAYKARADVMQLLVNHHSNVDTANLINKMNNLGHTPLYVCIKQKDFSTDEQKLEAVQFLLDNGALITGAEKSIEELMTDHLPEALPLLKNVTSSGVKMSNKF